MADETKAQVEAVRVKVTKPTIKAPLANDEALSWSPPTVAEARAMPLSESLANARAEFDRIRRGREGMIGNRKYKYADLSDIYDATILVLAKYNIEVGNELIYKTLDDDRGRPSMWMFIKVSALKGGDERSLDWPVGKIDEKNQTNGANLTYAKRYAYSLILNLSPEDDTDGQAAEDDDRPRNRGRDSDRDNGDRGRRSNFDDRADEGDPDAWRENIGNGNGRGDDRNGGDRDREDRREETKPVQQRKVRNDPSQQKRDEDPEDKRVSVAIDSLNSSGNKRSAETFWAMFKEGTKLAVDDPRYVSVKDLYTKRWKMHKAEEEGRKDPLGAATKEPEKKPAPEPDVHIENGHVSPDQALGEIEDLLEKCTSVTEFDRLLQEHAKLFEVASAFPPDEDLLNDMKEATLDRIKKAGPDERTQRMEDVEDSDRSENRRPDLGNERF